MSGSELGSIAACVYSAALCPVRWPLKRSRFISCFVWCDASLPENFRSPFPKVNNISKIDFERAGWSRRDYVRCYVDECNESWYKRSRRLSEGESRAKIKFWARPGKMGSERASGSSSIAVSTVINLQSRILMTGSRVNLNIKICVCHMSPQRKIVRVKDRSIEGEDVKLSRHGVPWTRV